MQQDEARTGARHEPDRVYERAADPAEAADRPLEPKSSPLPPASRDQPGPEARGEVDPHHSLNTPIGEVDPDADSDPYRSPSDDDDADRASGVRGSGQRSPDG